MKGHCLMIDRPYYIDWLKRWRDKDLIKVASGMRRAGKSTIMELFQKNLLESGVCSSNIISINFESFEEEYPLAHKELYRYVVQRLAPTGTNYVFLDEVQHVNQFEKVVAALNVRNDIDLYITGSNAYYLSGELATLLTGRSLEIHVTPYSFKEYSSAQPELTKDEAFQRYLIYGGLPYGATLTNDRDITQYLEGVFSTIFVKDIATRRPRMDMNAFTRTASFLADNVGNISSIRSIANAQSASKENVSQGAVNEHIDSLTETYLAYKVSRYDLKGKAYLQTMEKYYLGDLGFRYWLLGKSLDDVGRRLENVVYLELIRRYTHVDIGKQGTKEIDFVARRGSEVHYFQVAQTALDEKTLRRELEPLQNQRDSHPKKLLTLDRIGTGSADGIEHINLIDWLLEA